MKDSTFYLIAALSYGLLILILMAASPSQAAEPESFNEIQSAFSVAIDHLHEKGCLKPKITRMSSFVLSESGPDYQLDTRYRIFCDKWPPPVSATMAWNLTWDRPTTRENGSPLPENQIKGYNVYIGAATVPLFSAVNKYTTGPLPAGTVIKLKTVDMNGVESTKYLQFELRS